nr:MAG TPA: hypothetical protein [Caudoviricetes sp.]
MILCIKINSYLCNVKIKQQVKQIKLTNSIMTTIKNFQISFSKLILLTESKSSIMVQQLF